MNIGIDTHNPGMRLRLQVQVKALMVRAAIALAATVAAVELI